MSTNVHPVDEKLPWGRAATLGLQHVLVMYAGAVAVPLIVGRALNLPPEQVAHLISADLFVCGLVTLIHTIDPSGVLLGGAMTFGGSESELGRRFLGRIKKEIDARAFALLAERIQVEFAALGADAGYIGAAGIARLEHLRSRSLK